MFEREMEEYYGDSLGLDNARYGKDGGLLLLAGLLWVYGIADVLPQDLHILNTRDCPLMPN